MPINIASYLAPRVGGTYYLMEDLYLKGGYQSVATTTIRDAIDPLNRKRGMLVYCADTDKVYKLGANLTTWTEFSGSQSPSVKTYPNIVFNNANTVAGAGRTDITDTAPAGFNVGAGVMSLTFELVTNNYFASSTTGHVAFVLRCDMSQIGQQVLGAGAIVGNLVGQYNGAPTALDANTFNPVALVESWGAPAGARFLHPESATPYEKVLTDGTTYRWLVESCVSEDGTKSTRLAIWAYNVALRSWDLVQDSGNVVDHSLFDPTKSGLAIGHVFDANHTGAWSVNITNIKTVWQKQSDRPYTNRMPRQFVASAVETVSNSNTVYPLYGATIIGKAGGLDANKTRRGSNVSLSSADTNTSQNTQWAYGYNVEATSGIRLGRAFNNSAYIEDAVFGNSGSKSANATTAAFARSTGTLNLGMDFRGTTFTGNNSGIPANVSMALAANQKLWWEGTTAVGRGTNTAPPGNWDCNTVVPVDPTYHSLTTHNIIKSFYWLLNKLNDRGII